MAARVSKEDRELYKQFLDKLEDGASFLGVSEELATRLVLAADTFAQAKIKLSKEEAEKREEAAKKKAAAETAAPLPEAPKKKTAKDEKSATDSDEEATETTKLVEGRRYEALGSAKLKDAILVFRTPHGEGKGKFEVVHQGNGEVEKDRVVILPADKVAATKRRVPSKSKTA